MEVTKENVAAILNAYDLPAGIAKIQEIAQGKLETEEAKKELATEMQNMADYLGSNGEMVNVGSVWVPIEQMFEKLSGGAGMDLTDEEKLSIYGPVLVQVEDRKGVLAKDLAILNDGVLGLVSTDVSLGDYLREVVEGEDKSRWQKYYEGQKKAPEVLPQAPTN